MSQIVSTPPENRLARVNFKRLPYRGILGEVAAGEGVTQPAISRRLKNRDVRTIELVMAKVAEREEVVRRFEKATEGAA